MTARALGRTLAYYTLVSTVAACVATVVAIPFTGAVATAVTVAAVIVTGWMVTVVLDAVAARARGGRS